MSRSIGAVILELTGGRPAARARERTAAPAATRRRRLRRQIAAGAAGVAVFVGTVAVLPAPVKHAGPVNGGRVIPVSHDGGR